MHEYVELNHDGIVRETDKAVQIDFGDSQEWIPRSQMGALKDNTIEVTEWIAMMMLTVIELSKLNQDMLGKIIRLAEKASPPTISKPFTHKFGCDGFLCTCSQSENP